MSLKIKRATINFPVKVYGLVLSLSANQHSFAATALMLICEALEARGLIIDRPQPIFKDEI
jgi:hypothetical protein